MPDKAVDGALDYFASMTIESGNVAFPCEDVVSMTSGSLRGKATGFFAAWNLAPMKEPPY